MSLTVTNLVNYLKNKLDGDPNLRGVLVLGEISNFHLHQASGHCYFTLKDERSQLPCVMFKSSASKLKFQPKNGDKVLVNASVSVFESSGTMQLYVTSMKIDGLGDLYQQFEELKKKLNQEGYFDDLHKKQLKSKYLNKVAVLVGDKSAAMSDIKTCFLRRWPLTDVDYYPVLVQGVDAPKDIIEKLELVDAMNYDAIILARGGGSFEDLFCFNDENLVKCIFNLKTFIITGVGHEQDYTLVDFVADLRAPTPTASVELITPNFKDIKQLVEDLSHNDYFKNPYLLIENRQQKVDYLNQRLLSFSEVLVKYQALINSLNSRMNIKVSRSISDRKLLINSFKIKSLHSINDKFKENKNLLKRYEILLNAYSNENILKRGYSLTIKNGKLIKSIKDIKSKDKVEIKLKDGQFKAEVI